MSKTAIITGANKGIGLAIAKNLIEKDYQIILACRDKIKGKWLKTSWAVMQPF